MTPSLRVLLTGIVDYAGMFPPAKLPLEESIRNYARYHAEPESWMLGRFICPAARLAELSPFVDELFRDGAPLAVSALGRRRKNVENFRIDMPPRLREALRRQTLDQDLTTFRDHVRDDVNDISAFRQHHGERVAVDVLETSVPAEVPLREFADLLVTASRLVGPGIMLFCEAASPDDWPMMAGSFIAARHSIHQSGPVAGLKVRCGGLEPVAFPSSDQVMFAIGMFRTAEVPLKFTAGLHHPIRHHDSGIGTMMHGFLNVFVAGVLATARGLDVAEVRDIIEDEDAGSFIFTDDGLRWRNHRASITEIELARRTGVISFGSCSFDEPRDDLRALGLL